MALIQNKNNATINNNNNNNINGIGNGVGRHKSLPEINELDEWAEKDRQFERRNSFTAIPTSKKRQKQRRRCQRSESTRSVDSGYITQTIMNEQIAWSEEEVGKFEGFSVFSFLNFSCFLVKLVLILDFEKKTISVFFHVFSSAKLSFILSHLEHYEHHE